MLNNFYNGKKIFITGHTGFKGSWLCKILLLTGAEVTGYALSPPPSLFEQLNLKNDIHSIIGDIRNRELLAKAVREAKPDILFHLAAQPLVRLSYQEPALTYETNVMGTVNILEALRSAPSIHSFVNVTTDKVYENREWCWGYRENEPLCGYDPYSNSKSCSELVTSAYRNSFFLNSDAPSISTARSGNVIGGGDYSADRIIPDCVRAAESGRIITVRNPDSIRPYQHVLECLSGYLLLAEKQHGNKALEGAYNFGPGNDNYVTTSQLAELFCSAWKSGASWQVQGDGGPHEANLLKLDSTRARTVLGWKTQWDTAAAVEKIVEFAKLHTGEEQTACIDRQIREYFKF